MHLDDLDAILFDLDNTLVDRDAAMRRFLTAWLRRDGRDTAAIDRAMQVDDHGYTPRARFCAWWAARHGVDADAFWDEMRATIAEHVVADAVIVELVRRLSARLAVAIVTNGGVDTQGGKLRAAGLDGLLAPERVVVSGALGVAKPDPAIFDHALRQVRAAPQRTLFVGDHPAHDIIGADGAGLRTCWISRGRAQPRAFETLTQRPVVIASAHALETWLDDP